jgi:hypothetical protein
VPLLPPTAAIFYLAGPNTEALLVLDKLPPTPDHPSPPACNTPATCPLRDHVHDDTLQLPSPGATCIRLMPSCGLLVRGMTVSGIAYLAPAAEIEADPTPASLLFQPLVEEGGQVLDIRTAAAYGWTGEKPAPLSSAKGRKATTTTTTTTSPSSSSSSSSSSTDSTPLPERPFCRCLQAVIDVWPALQHKPPTASTPAAPLLPAGSVVAQAIRRIGVHRNSV